MNNNVSKISKSILALGNEPSKVHSNVTTSKTQRRRQQTRRKVVFPRAEYWNWEPTQAIGYTDIYESSKVLEDKAGGALAMPDDQDSKPDLSTVVCRIPSRPPKRIKEIGKARDTWRKVSTTYRSRIVKLAPRSLGFGGMDEIQDEIEEAKLLEDVDLIQGTPREELADEQHLNLKARDRFFDLYHDGSGHKRMHDTSAVRYLNQCEKEQLLPLPVLDFAQGTRVRRYSQSGLMDFSNYYFGDKRANALAEALEVLPLEITELNLKNTGLSEAGSAAILEKLMKTKVERLNLAQNRIGQKGCHTVSKVLLNKQMQLVSLNVANNELGDTAVISLLQTLQQRCTLESIDLSGNRLQKSTVLLSELINFNGSLKSVNLSWNQLRGEPALQLVRAIRHNTNLVHLDISHNSLGTDEAPLMALADTLRQNKTLEYLNLASNQIRAKPVLVLTDCMTENTSLKTVVLRGNPIGSAGGMAVFRLIARCDSKASFDLSMCNFEIEDKQVFIENNCTGQYRLNLAEPYDRMLAHTLLRMADAGQGSISRVKLAGREMERQAMLPETGILSLCFTNHDDCTICRTVSEDGFENMHQTLRNSFEIDDNRKANVVHRLSQEFLFTMAQANQILTLFNNSTNRLERADVAASLILQLCDREGAEEAVNDCAALDIGEFFEDKDNDGQIDACGDICTMKGMGYLLPFEQEHVETKLEKWISFNVNNPTASYRLNLANYVERLIMLRLVEANARDRQYRISNRLPQISQTPGHSSFRNVEFNHRPYLIETGWAVPKSGLISFDFVITKRPSSDCTALNDKVFEQFFSEFRSLRVKSHMKLIALRAVSSKYYFNCRQVAQMMEHFGPYDRNANGDLFRGLVFVTLYSRIIDEANFNLTMEMLDQSSHRRMLDRIGHMNLFNPIRPCGFYHLNLDILDQRKVLIYLVQFMNAQEGTFDNTFLNNCGLDVPGNWSDEDQVPKRGNITFKFSCPNKVARIQQLAPANVRRKVLDRLYNNKYKAL